MAQQPLVPAKDLSENYHACFMQHLLTICSLLCREHGENKPRCVLFTCLMRNKFEVKMQRHWWGSWSCRQPTDYSTCHLIGAWVSADINTVWEDFIIETSAVTQTCETCLRGLPTLPRKINWSSHITSLSTFLPFPMVRLWWLCPYRLHYSTFSLRWICQSICLTVMCPGAPLTPATLWKIKVQKDHRWST